jgi:hypothetical protein
MFDDGKSGNRRWTENAMAKRKKMRYMINISNLIHHVLCYLLHFRRFFHSSPDFRHPFCLAYKCLTMAKAAIEDGQKTQWPKEKK